VLVAWNSVLRKNTPDEQTDYYGHYERHQDDVQDKHDALPGKGRCATRNLILDCPRSAARSQHNRVTAPYEILAISEFSYTPLRPACLQRRDDLRINVSRYRCQYRAEPMARRRPPLLPPREALRPARDRFRLIGSRRR
jgi:hypothetical protein